MGLRPCGLYSHLLGAALGSLGDLEAAAEAETRSVDLVSAAGDDFRGSRVKYPSTDE